MLQRLATLAILSVLLALPTGVRAQDGAVIETLPLEPPGAAQAQPAPAPPPAPAATQSDALYTVSGVEVDVTAGTASEARDQAFFQGQGIALGQLAERLGVSQAELDPSSLPPETVARLLQSFQVEEEQTAAGRYIATLTYSFRPEEVRQLLSSRGATFAAPPTQPALIIPVYRGESGTRLWDSPNPWLAAWLDFPDGNSLVPVVVPFGDLQDMREVDIDAALSGDTAALETMAQRYGAREVVVAVAEPQGESLSVTVNRYGGRTSGGSEQISVPQAAEGEEGANQLALAVEQTTALLDESWRSQAQVQSGERNSMTVLVPLAGTGDSWFNIQERLRQVPTVVEADILSLSPREAVVDIRFMGSEAQFREAIAQQNLTIREGVYAPELRLTGAF
ncbi:DUF2066 domain-containing protein [Inquilinus sp. CAU 1745]|uniref:DUF2066 domain-containing protein n=1 Tax=Inquilinus sp. CAU 1745 TaxID=3140369 RepID=UPI00325B52FC